MQTTSPQSVTLTQGFLHVAQNRHQPTKKPFGDGFPSKPYIKGFAEQLKNLFETRQKPFGVGLLVNPTSGV